MLLYNISQNIDIFGFDKITLGFQELVKADDAVSNFVRNIGVMDLNFFFLRVELNGIFL